MSQERGRGPMVARRRDVLDCVVPAGECALPSVVGLEHGYHSAYDHEEDRVIRSVNIR